MKIKLELTMTECMLLIDMLRDSAPRSRAVVQPRQCERRQPRQPTKVDLSGLSSAALAELKSAARHDWAIDQAELAEQEQAEAEQPEPQQAQPEQAQQDEQADDEPPARRDWWEELLADATARAVAAGGRKPTHGELRQRYSIGYSVATRLLDTLTSRGVITQPDLAGPLPDPAKVYPERAKASKAAKPAATATASDDDDDDDDDDDKYELAKASASLRPPEHVLEACKAARSNAEAIMAVLRWRAGQRTSAAYIFEILRTQRSVTVGSLTKTLQELASEQKISRVDRGVFQCM